MTKRQQMGLELARAIGIAATKEDHSIVDLKGIPELKGYAITYHRASHSDGNDSYALYYHGKHGNDNGTFSRLMDIEAGWQLSHMVALFVNAIEMHKAEKK